MDPIQDSFRSWVRGYAKKNWYLLVGLGFIALISIGFSLLAPLPMKYLADYVFGNQPVPSYISGMSKSQLLILVAVFYFTVNALSNLFSVLESIVRVRCNQIIDRKVMLEVFSKTNDISVSHPLRKDSGTYTYQITQQSQVLSGYILGNGVTIFRSLVMISSVISILTAIDIRMTLLCLISIPSLTFVVIYFGKIIEKKADAIETAHAAVFAFINDTLAKLRTVQVFAKESFSTKSLDDVIINRNKKANQLILANNLFGFSSSSVILVIITTVLLIGGKDVLNGHLTFGDLLLFIAYMNGVFGPINGIIKTAGGARQQQAALLQVYRSVLDAEAASQQHKNGLKDVKIQGKILFQNISYSVKGKPVFENASFSIEAGSMNALVGPSGQGKSTIINMLLGFIKPDEGSITIDGHQIDEYDVRFLRENIALVDQEPDIFNMSIHDNIAYANQDIPNNIPDVMAAAVVTNSSEFIDTANEKYEHIVGNDRLSGGQKQRLAIARAYYKRAPIILMDEPTSALDRHSSKIFVDSLDLYYKGETVVLITHDLSLLSKIPNIFVVENKKVQPVEQFGGLESYKSHIHS